MKTLTSLYRQALGQEPEGIIISALGLASVFGLIVVLTLTAVALGAK